MMKLRPVLLVVLILFGFYYLTTHVGSTSAFTPWLHRASPAVATPCSEHGGGQWTQRTDGELRVDRGPCRSRL